MKLFKFLLIGCALFSSSAFAAEPNAVFDNGLANIQQRWAEISYRTDKDHKVAEFEALAKQAEQFAAAYPQRAEALIWQGIVVSTWAGAKGGLGALSLVEQAKALFETSLRLDERALQGSAYTSLGSLYYQAPGWPIGFGDDDKAQGFLQKALAINPRGIDANYFYADFLIDQGNYKQANVYLNRALQAPPRADRALADQGRREEIRQRLAQLREYMDLRAENNSFFN